MSLVTLTTCTNSFESEVIKGRLAAENIPCLIQVDTSTRLITSDAVAGGSHRQVQGLSPKAAATGANDNGGKNINLIYGGMAGIDCRVLVNEEDLPKAQEVMKEE